MKNLRFWKDITLGVAVFSLAACSTQKEEPLQPLDDVMMQAFYWDVPVDDQAKDGTWWDHLSSLAPELKGAGISSLWTPIPAKGNWGIYDSGYGIYDHYEVAMRTSRPIPLSRRMLGRDFMSRTLRATSNGRTIRLIRGRIFSFRSIQARANRITNGIISTSIHRRQRTR